MASRVGSVVVDGGGQEFEDGKTSQFILINKIILPKAFLFDQGAPLTLLLCVKLRSNG
jgi:hypothetical protein